MNFFGIAKHKGNIKIFFETPKKYIYELTVEHYHENEEYILNYKEALDYYYYDNNINNIAYNLRNKIDKIELYKKYIVPEHYKIYLTKHIKDVIKYPTFNDYLEKRNEKIYSEKNEYKKIEMYEIIFNEEYKKMIDFKSKEYDCYEAETIMNKFLKLIKGSNKYELSME